MGLDEEQRRNLILCVADYNGRRNDNRPAIKSCSTLTRLICCVRTTIGNTHLSYTRGKSLPCEGQRRLLRVVEGAIRRPPSVRHVFILAGHLQVDVECQSQLPPACELSKDTNRRRSSRTHARPIGDRERTAISEDVPPRERSLRDVDNPRNLAKSVTVEYVTRSSSWLLESTFSFG